MQHSSPRHPLLNRSKTERWRTKLKINISQKLNSLHSLSSAENWRQRALTLKCSSITSPITFILTYRHSNYPRAEPTPIIILSQIKTKLKYTWDIVHYLHISLAPLGAFLHDSVAALRFVKSLFVKQESTSTNGWTIWICVEILTSVYALLIEGRAQDPGKGKIELLFPAQTEAVLYKLTHYENV